MESKGNPKNNADKKQPQDDEEELKDQPQNLITTIPTQDDTEKMLKDLMDRFANVKFTQDEKDHLKEILKTGDTPESRMQINKFLSESKESRKQSDQKRELKKVAALYDTHDFWQTQPVPKVNE